MPGNTYGSSVFHSGYLGTTVFNASGFSYVVTAGVPVLTAPTAGTAITGGAEMPVVDWATEPTATIVPMQNSKSGPNPLKEATFVDDTNITITLDYDFAANPYLAANGGITVGNTIPWVVFFLNQTKKSALDGKYTVYSSLIVKSTPIKVVVKGTISLQFKAEAAGPFWLPQS